MRQIRLLLGMAGFLVLWLASPAALRAQCGTCSDATDVNGRWQHTFGGLAGAWMGCGSNCHRYFVTGLCLDNHGGCVGALNAGVEKVRVALESDDIPALRVALAELGGSAKVNEKDSSIDLLSCDESRTLVARFPAPVAAVAALVTRRPVALRE